MFLQFGKVSSGPASGGPVMRAVGMSLGGNIIAPLVDGGQRAAEVKIRTTRQSDALALYSAGARESAVGSERDRFEAGETDLFRLDEARVRYYGAMRDANAVRVALLRNRVRLHLALCGSFASPTPTPQEVASASVSE